MLNDEHAFNNSPARSGTFLLTGDGIRVGAGQVNVVLAGMTGVANANDFTNGNRNVRVTV